MIILVNKSNCQSISSNEWELRLSKQGMSVFSLHSFYHFIESGTIQDYNKSIKAKKRAITNCIEKG
jgi:hypothetical protein